MGLFRVTFAQLKGLTCIHSILRGDARHYILAAVDRQNVSGLLHLGHLDLVSEPLDCETRLEVRNFPPLQYLHCIVVLIIVEIRVANRALTVVVGEQALHWDRRVVSIAFEVARPVLLPDIVVLSHFRLVLHHCQRSLVAFGFYLHLLGLYSYAAATRLIRHLWESYSRRQMLLNTKRRFGLDLLQGRLRRHERLQ